MVTRCDDRCATIDGLRILFVSHYALPHMGGIEFIVDALARGMLARGHEVTQIAADTDDAEAELPYRVLRIPANNTIERRFGIPVPIVGRSLLRTLRREIANADVVHAHGMLYQACAVALWMAKLRGHRCRVLTEHVGHVPYDDAVVNAIESLAIATIGKVVARSAHAIITTANPRVEAEMAAIAPAVRRIDIPNGVDVERFHPGPKGPRDRPRILFVGRMVEKKGVMLAIETARRLGDGFELILAGRGDVPPLPPNARYVGALSQERLAELYRECDLFLLPSRGEGFPLSAQEALASGLPIILSDESSYRSALAGSGGAATLVLPDPDTIAAAVREVLSGDHGEAAARFARERFSWDATVERHLALYDGILTAGGTPPD